MSKAAKLPDFIEVANIKDLFWNNNSDLYPTCVPSEYITIEKTRPTFLSPYLGTCVLRGEYNHCIFNGTYYFLTKLRVLDIMSEEYEYQLDYDVMINFLNKGVNVKGTLIKTNKEDILEECLQTTVPILSDPVKKKIYGNRENKKQPWQSNVSFPRPDFRIILESLQVPIITRENFTAFIRRVETHPLARATKDKEWLAKRLDGGGWNYYAQQNPLFVLDSIPMTPDVLSWKYKVLTKVVEWTVEASSTQENFVITKQTTPSDHFNVGGYVLGIKDKTLGANIASEVYITELDITGLRDIVPIDNKTGQKLEGNATPEYKLLPHRSRISSIPYILALLRNPYLPIGNEKSTEGCIPPEGELLNYCQEKLFIGNNTPQKIETKDGKINYFWYLNKNNLALVEDFSSIRYFTQGRLTNSTWTGERTRWGFFRADYRNVAPLGFLIYQLWKPYSEWNDLEYIGDGANKLSYRAGISAADLNDLYINNAHKYWWGNADDRLLELWGTSKPLSRLFLDIDEFNWLSIAPSDKGRTYKYHSEDYWGYKEFFPSAGNIQWYYPSVLNRMFIEWNGKSINTPYSHSEVNTPLQSWLERRDKKLRDVSLFETVDLQGEITKGDIVTTNLEHSWYTVHGSNLGIFPYKLSTDTWDDIISKINEKYLLQTEKYDAETSELLQRISKAEAQLGAGAGGAAVAIIGLALAGIATVLTGGVAAPVAASVLGGTITAVGVGFAASGAITKNTIAETLKPDVINNVINVGIYKSKTSNQNILGDQSIVFYLYQGKYRIGIYKKKRITGKLDDDEDNLIKYVDGTKSKEFDLSIIHPLEHGELDFNNETVIGEEVKSEIIQYALGHGEFVPGRKYHNYTFEDLKIGTHTFDLVGTNWYLVIHNDTVNFVAKSNDVWKTVVNEGEGFEIKDDVSTFSKINQKATLNYYGQQYPLNTKFKFTGEWTEPTSYFSYRSGPIVLDNKYADPDVEYRMLGVKLPNDDISVITTIPRKETRAAETVDSTQVLMMKERLLQQTMNYEQDKYANQLMINDKRQAMARQREDLNHNWYRAVAGITLQGINTVGSTISGIGSGGLSGALSGGLESMQGVGSLAMGAGVDFLIRYPTLMTRIDENERDMLLANSQQLYQRRQNYEHDFKYQTLKLNKIAGSYQKLSVTNRDAQEVFNKELGVGNGFVEILLPSEEQEKQINHIYETFGCECISDRFVETPLAIYSGMNSGLYKFSKIESGGITSLITDTTLRGILKQILENGVKFSGCPIEVDKSSTQTSYLRVPKSRVKPKVIFTTDNIKDWALDKWDTYRLQTDKPEIIDTLKKLPHHGLTDEEWEQHKDHFKDIDDDKLLELVNQIINGRETGESIIIKLPKRPPTEADVDKLNQTITTLTAEITNLQEQIKSNDQVCEANKQQLEEEKRALQTQLTQCQQQHSEITKEKEGKEGQITIIQGQINSLTLEKLELEKQLNECKNQIKRLIAAQKRCDEINTAEIKRLKGELEKCEKEKEELLGQINTIKEQLKDLNKQLEGVNALLTTCTKAKEDKDKEITTLNEKIKELNLRPTTTDHQTLRGQLEAKTKELEELQKQCEADKTELDKKKRELEAEIHQHKVDKEELEQKLNDERRRAINEKDEINKLKKQIEDSKGDRDKITQLEEQLKTKETEWTTEKQQLIEKFKQQMAELQKAINAFKIIGGSSAQAQARIKELEEELETIKLEKATCDERIAAKHRELEQCRTELMLAKEGQPTQEYKPKVQDECALWQSIVRDPYQYELKSRENGWDAFLDLVFELAQVLTWEGRTDLDQKLFKVNEVRPILEKLEELKNVPIIDKAIDLMKTEGWPVFLEYIEKGGDINGRIPKVVEKFNVIKMMETTPTVHAVKALLDELNWVSYKAKAQLTEQLKTNQDLQTLYAHIYPGTKTLELYKALYGDPKWALIRKRFTDEIKCVGEGGRSMIEWADDYRKSTDFITTDIKKPELKPEAKAVEPEKPKSPPKPAEVRIYISSSVTFRPSDSHKGRQVRNLIPNFNEAVKGQWTSERDPGYTWLIWNYKYTKYLNSRDWYYMVWLKQRVLGKEQAGRYVALKDSRYNWIHIDRVISAVEVMWRNRAEMSVDADFINGLKNGTIKAYAFICMMTTFKYDFTKQMIALPTQFITDLDSAGILEDFIKLMHILNKNRILWEYLGKDTSDKYAVYSWLSVDVNTQLASYKNIGKGNSAWYIGSDHYGLWLFPTESAYDKSTNKWISVYGLSDDWITYGAENSLYQLVRWSYEVITGKRSFEHPYKIGAGGAYAFMKAICDLSTR